MSMPKEIKELLDKLRATGAEVKAMRVDEDGVHEEIPEAEAAALLRGLGGKGSPRGSHGTNTPETLMQGLATLSQHTSFSRGDLVTWKPHGMRNRKYPEDGQPCIVVEMIDQPLMSDDKSGSAYYREVLDMKIGYYDADQEFNVWHVDSRRFTQWKAPNQQ